MPRSCAPTSCRSAAPGPLAKIDQLAVQTWITGLSARLSPVRSRVWRPPLVRAGLLGSVTPHGGYLPQWTDQAGKRHRVHVDDEAPT